MNDNGLDLFTAFHLNLAYSSIPEEERGLVIERCYWPLLDMAADLGVPIGVEATGWTLETAHDIDPAWTKRLRDMIGQGLVDPIASGYSQVIAPLVPAEVNEWNLRLGNHAYDRILGTKPSIVLVNEQAWSGGLVSQFLDAGYTAAVMEWNNPASAHPEWDPALQYRPQRAQGPNGRSIAILWNQSILFQQFQRVAHGHWTPERLLRSLAQHTGPAPRTLCLYGNDVEVFDHRPGRYATEPPLEGGSEWARIRGLMERLNGDGRFRFVTPSSALQDAPPTGTPLRLETETQPIPVKKQGKYNVTRWAVTGRDDIRANTSCRLLYERLKSDEDASPQAWRELCRLWSSDFRTHIEPTRWSHFQDDLARACPPQLRATPVRPSDFRRRLVEQHGDLIVLQSRRSRAEFLPKRGLAVAGAWLGTTKGTPAFGTIEHGHFNDIRLGADWYTGHVVAEIPGRPKVTDLAPATDIQVDETDEAVVLRGTIPTILGPVRKEIRLLHDRERMEITYQIDWPKCPPASIRLGHVTFHPDTFRAEGLHYATHNGGHDEERFPLGARPVDLGRSVSMLVSATGAIGMTKGYAAFRDDQVGYRIEVDHAATTLVGIPFYENGLGERFLRLALSAGEIDETRRTDERPFVRTCKMAINREDRE